MGAKILVTGGTGYIGSHTVVELQKSGYDVIIVDDLSNSIYKIVSLIHKITGRMPGFEQLDLCDEKGLNLLFEKHHDLRGVIHFAAHKAVGESVEKPLKYYHNNLQSLINLLKCQIDHGVDHFVFSSSCTVYGQPDSLPVSESAPLKPATSPYGNTKKIAEDIIRDTIGVSSIRAISLRYFNPVGAHESGLIGELPLGAPQNLVPFITQTAIGKQKVLKVFGNDYNTPDGSCIRDYIHVTDLAKAHVVAVERLLQVKNEAPYEVFNLGTGNGYSVLEVIDAFEKVTGLKVNMEIAGRRPGDVEKVWADTAYANLKLGWKARLGLEKMMHSAWMWEKNLAAGIIEQA